jgi:iron complex transport system substrate-binding protein
MGQPGQLRVLFVLLLLAASAGCDGGNPTPPPKAKSPTVASFVPGATDLIIGMGAADHLVAVSTYDRQPEVKHLPRAGDYERYDWEQIATLRPDVMVIFTAPERQPPALKERAASLKIRLVNIQTERIDDIYPVLARLGELLAEKAKADDAAKRLRDGLAAIAQKTRGVPPVRTLIVREKTYQEGVVGAANFLDDALRMAGGANVLTDAGWPTIDRERLLTLAPDAIFHLLPDATPQVVEQAKRLWADHPELPAVKNQRVHILTESWVQQPGTHLPDLAKAMAERLHPEVMK